MSAVKKLIAIKDGKYVDALVNLNDVVGWGVCEKEDELDPEVIELYFDNAPDMKISCSPWLFRSVFDRHLMQREEQ